MGSTLLIRSTWRRAVAGAASVFLLWAILAIAASVPATAAAFSNPTNVFIPLGGAATPYPSTISVSGLTGTVTDVNVTLTGYQHPSPEDVDVLLVGPTGHATVLMTDAGGSTPLSSAVTLTFDDEASGSVTAPVVSGTYQPDFALFCTTCGFGGPSPAPAAPYHQTLAVYDGKDPNGPWSLFVYDDHVNFDPASVPSAISGGWSLEITLGSPTIDSIAPTSGPVGTQVVIAGTNLSGATAVAFGGVPSAFTVDLPTQVTATVPPGAVSGPVTITTPNGTATSPTGFTVTTGPGPGQEHARTVTLSVGRRAKGAVSVGDGHQACVAGVPIKIQQRMDGKWRRVGGTLTGPTGRFALAGTDEPGRYRAVAKEVTLPSGDVCLRDVSPIAKKP